ncbi:TetR/AcrR family transcriptional regulator [Brevundimonas sp. AAP58]|uniref:TetR/AcrR family transcriptional regulator n=1 Tax=Brevundimonas sp. AAP58 TaxID=1523422 RepID=UPI0006B97538|nr:helix-turn-helix domain-containing protein [Brevundimonas sp. AAP58]
MGVRKENKAQTRTKVLDAARGLFSELGYHPVTMRLIAAKAGLTTGAVFYHFEHKAGAWRAAMGCEPPEDRVNARFAAKLAGTLEDLVSACRSNDPTATEAVLVKAEALLARLDQKA